MSELVSGVITEAYLLKPGLEVSARNRAPVFPRLGCSRNDFPYIRNLSEPESLFSARCPDLAIPVTHDLQ